eukprot:g28308.t1
MLNADHSKLLGDSSLTWEKDLKPLFVPYMIKNTSANPPILRKSRKRDLLWALFDRKDRSKKLKHESLSESSLQRQSPEQDLVPDATETPNKTATGAKKKKTKAGSKSNRGNKSSLRDEAGRFQSLQDGKTFSEEDIRKLDVAIKKNNKKRKKGKKKKEEEEEE